MIKVRQKNQRDEDLNSQILPKKSQVRALTFFHKMIFFFFRESNFHHLTMDSTETNWASSSLLHSGGSTSQPPLWEPNRQLMAHSWSCIVGNVGIRFKTRGAGGGEVCSTSFVTFFFFFCKITMWPYWWRSASGVVVLALPKLTSAS